MRAFTKIYKDYTYGIFFRYSILCKTNRDFWQKQFLGHFTFKYILHVLNLIVIDLDCTQSLSSGKFHDTANKSSMQNQDGPRLALGTAWEQPRKLKVKQFPDYIVEI